MDNLSLLANLPNHVNGKHLNVYRWLDLVSVHASRMEDNKNDLLPRVYIEVDSLEELQSLIEELSIGYRQLSNDEYRFEMLDSIVIDFQFKVITLYDYYLE